MILVVTVCAINITTIKEEIKSVQTNPSIIAENIQDDNLKGALEQYSIIIEDTPEEIAWHQKEKFLNRLQMCSESLTLFRISR